MRFIKEFIHHPVTIGAIAPSSSYLAKQMIRTVDFSNCKCLVEYGPGTGSFSKEIIRRKREDTLFLLIEQNEQFYQQLVQKYGDTKNIKIIYGSAEQTQQIMGMEGTFITFQYSKLKMNVLKQYFVIQETFLEVRNLPPAHVFVMKNREKL